MALEKVELCGYDERSWTKNEKEYKGLMIQFVVPSGDNGELKGCKTRDSFIMGQKNDSSQMSLIDDLKGKLSGFKRYDSAWIEFDLDSYNNKPVYRIKDIRAVKQQGSAASKV